MYGVETKTIQFSMKLRFKQYTGVFKTMKANYRNRAIKWLKMVKKYLL